MKLIIGLGNPGNKYQLTRHNTGFMALNAYGIKKELDFKLETKFEAEIAVARIKENVLFVKPMTFMNLSGVAINKIVKFYKVDYKDILVIYDDIALDTGKLRLREKGSAGGHNGIKSIISFIGDEFKRVRIGIGNPIHDAVDYVLGKFTESEKALMNLAYDNVSEIIDLFINDEPYEKIMNKFN